jgi:hypothetical protein
MGPPPDDLVAACARIAGDELNWDADRRDQEIAAVTAIYRV